MNYPEVIESHKFRVFDILASKWRRYSFWSKASDVELEDGTNVQDTIDEINSSLQNTQNFVGVEEPLLVGANLAESVNEVNVSLMMSRCETIQFSNGGNTITETFDNNDSLVTEITGNTITETFTSSSGDSIVRVIEITGDTIVISENNEES